jgi:cell division protein FtsI (penicillin-binding protein 3)
VDKKAVARKLRKDTSFVWIKRQVDGTEAARVRALRKEGLLPGVHLRKESKRVYPQGQLAAHVVGFTDIDGRGLAGIELSMDGLLRGRPGVESVMCDGGRRIIRSVRDRLERSPFDGYDVYLTIDAQTQDIVEQELHAAVEQHEPECAVAVVMDVRDGSVMAMASWPTFDPQRPTDSPVANQRNVAITDSYEFGSVFKPVTVGVALEDDLVTPETIFNCHQGEYRIGARTLHDVHPYDDLTVSDIICHSSNIGAAQISMLLGKEGLHGGVQSFGFGAPSGIALPGEVGGLVRPLDCWNDYSVVSVAFGQELAVTALSMVRAYAAFASGGRLLSPRIVQRVVHSESGEVLFAAEEPTATSRPVSPQTANQVMAMLARVVEEGTGGRARNAEYAIAGKTGTAQLLREDGAGYSDSRHLSSFIGMAPAPDCRIVVLVALKAPSKNGHYGGTVAAPAVKKIVRKTLVYLNVPPARCDELALGDSQ